MMMAPSCSFKPSGFLFFLAWGLLLRLEVVHSKRPRPTPPPTVSLTTTSPSTFPSSSMPSGSPSILPTAWPTASTQSPTENPTMLPTASGPTMLPTTLDPTMMPTTLDPTAMPTTLHPTVVAMTHHPTMTTTTLDPTIPPATLDPTAMADPANDLSEMPSLAPTIPGIINERQVALPQVSMQVVVVMADLFLGEVVHDFVEQVLLERVPTLQRVESDTQVTRRHVLMEIDSEMPTMVQVDMVNGTAFLEDDASTTSTDLYGILWNFFVHDGTGEFLAHLREKAGYPSASDLIVYLNGSLVTPDVETSESLDDPNTQERTKRVNDDNDGAKDATLTRTAKVGIGLGCAALITVALVVAIYYRSSKSAGDMSSSWASSIVWSSSSKGPAPPTLEPQDTMVTVSPRSIADNNNPPSVADQSLYTTPGEVQADTTIYNASRLDHVIAVAKRQQENDEDDASSTSTVTV